MGLFNVFAYVAHDATFAASDMTALLLMDHFALLRDSLLTVLRLGLNDEVLENTQPLNYISRLEASFNDISDKLSMFFITHYSVVRDRMLVHAGVINRDISVYESDLSKFVRDKYSGAMPPGAGTAIEMFPVPPPGEGRWIFLTRGECC